MMDGRKGLEPLAMPMAAWLAWLEAQRRAERYRRHQAWTYWRRACALDAFFIGRSGGSRNNRLWPQFLAVGALNARRQGSGRGAGGDRRDRFGS